MMKHAKRIFAVILALCMILSMGVTVFAEDETTQSDMTEVTVTKVYTLVGDGSSPAETFTLEQVKKSVVDSMATTAPDLKAITGAKFEAGAAAEDGAEGTITITLPSYEYVGVYEYILQEVAGTTAGVDYYGDEIKLVVTVVNDETGKLRVAAVHTESEGDEKSDTFENTYSAGSLSISKTVTGNLGDKTKYFDFTVTLTGEEGKTYAESFAVTGGKYENGTTAKLGENKFQLKDGDTLTIANLPYGVSYTVTEATPEDYDLVNVDGDTGVIEAAEAEASFTNDKSGEVDTGIVLDSIPYILTLAVVAFGALVLFFRKRAAE